MKELLSTTRSNTCDSSARSGCVQGRANRQKEPSYGDRLSHRTRRISGDYRARRNVAGDNAAAPTMAFSPMVTPHRMVALVPMDAPRFTCVGTTDQSAGDCGVPSGLVARGLFIVDERHIVSDEDVVFDDHAFADK